MSKIQNLIDEIIDNNKIIYIYEIKCSITTFAPEIIIINKFKNNFYIQKIKFLITDLEDNYYGDLYEALIDNLIFKNDKLLTIENIKKITDYPYIVKHFSSYKKDKNIPIHICLHMKKEENNFYSIINDMILIMRKYKIKNILNVR